MGEWLLAITRKVKRRYWRVELPYACFALTSEGDTVIEAAPIAKHILGGSLNNIINYYNQCGRVTEIFPYANINSKEENK